jgi:hypothetical protein
MIRRAAFFLIVLLAAGCSDRPGANDGAQQRPLTQEERERAIARSPLPGAPVVGRAVAVRDSSRARAARADGRGR